MKRKPDWMLYFLLLLVSSLTVQAHLRIAHIAARIEALEAEHAAPAELLEDLEDLEELPAHEAPKFGRVR